LTDSEIICRAFCAPLWRASASRTPAATSPIRRSVPPRPAAFFSASAKAAAAEPGPPATDWASFVARFVAESNPAAVRSWEVTTIWISLAIADLPRHHPIGRLRRLRRPVTVAAMSGVVKPWHILGLLVCMGGFTGVVVGVVMLVRRNR
jgi:hypothetical protein